jgi:hypothetical protein
MMDLLSRETMREFLSNRTMKSVYQTIIKGIIFIYARVPDELRSDSTPEFMQGIARQVANI